MRTLIIGYGNPLRGDDGLGWRVAEELATHPEFSEAEIVSRHQLTPEMAEHISHADRVLFIDATRDGTPGEITCQPVNGASIPTQFSHQYSPDELLALAHALYGARARGFVFTMCGRDFEHGDKLSPIVASRIPVLVERLVEATRDGFRDRTSDASSPVQLDT